MTSPREHGIESAPLRVIRTDPYNAETPEFALSEVVTPSQHVYVRSNFHLPVLDDSHVIHVGGAVRAPYALAAADLRTLPQQTIGCTMECAGNDRLTMQPLPTGEPWASGALSTAEWCGPSLRDVLDRAGVAASACEVLVSAMDAGARDDASDRVTFARSLPLDDALHPDTILALTMNGLPLTREHGAPVRLVVPGWYGMANVKWVHRIDVLNMPFTGYFQRQRYVYDVVGAITPVTRMRVKSVITSPAAGTSNPRQITARGWAWSGAGAIRRVDLSLDGGDEWVTASIGQPATPYSWTPWEYPITVSHDGRHSLRSRATDSTGQTQPDTVTWNRLGYGNNAVRTVVFDVRTE